MLVEINLLPQKKQRKSSTIIKIVIILALISMLFSLLTFWKVQRYNNKINGLQANITDFQQIIEALQQDVSAESTSSYVELSNAVEWSSSYPIKSVAVLKHLTSLLPERGFLLNYSYLDTGTISLSVQFDTKKEAAYYLKWLNDSEWIETVNLSQLSSNQIESTGDFTVSETENVGQKETQIYLPRYTGSFEITLNKEKIKESQQQSENNKEGGDDQ
jgi:type IV pilus assembly protein PilN